MNASPAPSGSTSSPLPKTLPLEVWGATDKGRQREGNEDAVYPHSESGTFPFQPSPDRLQQKGQLLVVADGVGGAQAGREASHWAIRVAVERYYDMPGLDIGADLKAAVEIANSSLYQYLQSTKVQEAGCTMTAAVIHGDMLYIANVGDSRTYLLRGGGIYQQTRDHTLTREKLERGLITPEQMPNDPDRNVITRSLGAGPAVQVDLFPPLQLMAGDVVLLCSDGLPDMLTDAEIAAQVNNQPLPRIAQRLIAEANRHGGFDNISVVLARVGGRAAVAPPPKAPKAPKSPPAGGGPLASFTSTQRLILGILAALVVIAVLALGVTIGWSLFKRGGGTPTPTSSPAVTTTSPVVVTTAPVAGETPTPTPRPGESPQPTATLRPTATSTPTRTPRPPTATPTPEPPTLTPTPSEAPGGGGGTTEPPTTLSPTTPPPTEEKTLPPITTP